MTISMETYVGATAIGGWSAAAMWLVFIYDNSIDAIYQTLNVLGILGLDTLGVFSMLCLCREIFSY